MQKTIPEYIMEEGQSLYLILNAQEETKHRVETTLANIRSKNWIVEARKSVKQILPRKFVVCKYNIMISFWCNLKITCTREFFDGAKFHFDLIEKLTRACYFQIRNHVITYTNN